MLSKIKKDIPPGLIRIVRGEKNQKKYLFIIGASVLAVLLGFTSLFIFNSYLKDTSKNPTPISEQNLPTDTKNSQPDIKMESVTVKNESPSFTENKASSKTESPKNVSVETKKNPTKFSKQEKIIENREIPITSPHLDTFREVDYLYRAQDFENKGMYKEAVIEYIEYLNITKKKDPKILNKIATFYLFLNNLSEASHYAETAFNIAPKNVSILINNGVIKAKLKDFTKAEDYFKSALALEPNNKNALYNLALLKEQKGEFEEARRLYEKLLQLGDPYALEGIERVKLISSFQ